MRFEKVWVEQCRATKAIKRRFGAKSALDYLVGEKLISFADAARNHAAFARELPRFLAAIWQTFNEYEIAGYVVRRRRPRGALIHSDQGTQYGSDACSTIGRAATVISAA